MANPFEDAMALADAIVRYQKQKRAQPYVQELQRIGSQWAGATPQAQQNLNAQNNAIRNAYLQAGGSPIDIDRSLWGSNPNQGFQTGTKQFTPGYFGDNLSYGQKAKLADITGMYERKPTWARQVQEAGLTGMYQGRPTPDYMNLLASLSGYYTEPTTGKRMPTLASRELDLRSALGWDESQRSWTGLGLEQQKSASDAKTKALNKAFEYINGLNPQYKDVNGVTTVVTPGWSEGTKTQLRAIVQNYLNTLLNSPDPYDQLNKAEAGLRKTYPKTADAILSALQVGLSQYNMGF